MTAPDYPWFAVTAGADLQQGDLLRGCLRFTVLPDARAGTSDVQLVRVAVNAIVLTQSCDLAVRTDGNCEATDILLAPYYEKQELANHPSLRRDEAWEEARKGRRPFLHVLDECRIPGWEREFVLVDFHGLFTLSVALVRDFAAQASPRLRLLPPYREHLSQAFARLFMRVGLPADIAPFGKKK